jgi:hypothetical protein
MILGTEGLTFQQRRFLLWLMRELICIQLKVADMLDRSSADYHVD